MACNKATLALFLFVSLSWLCVNCEDKADEPVVEQEIPEEDVQKAEYAKGSLCGYCDYCKVSNDADVSHPFFTRMLLAFTIIIYL